MVSAAGDFVYAKFSEINNNNNKYNKYIYK